MWNPSTDTILFVEAESRHCFDLFLNQFPAQVKEIQRLALPRSFWPEEAVFCPHSAKRLWLSLMKFVVLQKLFIFVDRESFEDWVGDVDVWRNPGWRFPIDVRRKLCDARRHYQESHGRCPIEVPSVSVAWSHDMNLDEENVERGP
jgi:hypothetical protein